MLLHCSLAVIAFAAQDDASLRKSRDAQDRPALEQQIAKLKAAAKPDNADSQYKVALAQSYLAEVAQEQRDKNAARAAAEAGMDPAKKAIAIKGDGAEYHRVLGTLCGQVIPANVLAGLKYGKCAQSEVEQALKLDPKLVTGYIAQGVGNYYLPPSFGGGVELAIKSFEKAIALDPKSSDAQVWLGIALRKANRNGDARKAFQKALDLNPARRWAKEQLDKTPAQ
jgi:tetratricopeptide (TPR) repeat protein